MKLRDWYTLTAKAGSDVAELNIFGEIGGGWLADEDAPTGKRVAKELAALPESIKTIRVRVNSPGGSVFDGLYIANALRRESRERNRTVEIDIEALAASAATLVTSAGDTIRMPRTSLMMVHDPSGVVMGSAKDMRKIAEALDRITGNIVAAYRWVSPKSDDELRALMAETTFMDADEALANGFVTEITDGVEAAATFALDEVEGALGAAIPEKYRPLFKAKAGPVVADPAAIIRACKAAGFPELAEDMLNQPMAAVETALKARTDAKAEAETRATAIRGHTKLALKGKPEVMVTAITAKAERWIAEGRAVAQCQADLTDLAALLAAAEIDSGLKPDAKKIPAVVNVAEDYARLNTPGKRS